MTKLRWTRSWTFLDNRRQFKAMGPGVYDVPDDAVEGYLERSDGWEQPDGEAPAEDSTEDSSTSEEEADTEDDVDEEDEAASDDSEVVEETSVDERSDEDLKSVLDQNVPDLEEDLSSGEFDGDLDRLEDLEEDGESRTTALTAIKSRKDEISEE